MKHVIIYLSFILYLQAGYCQQNKSITSVESNAPYSNGSIYNNGSKPLVLNDFIKLDAEILNVCPRMRDYATIKTNLLKISKEKIRFVDSLDYYFVNDTLNVKIYAQDYAYQTNNIYKLAPKSILNDSLYGHDLKVDFKMKSIIEEFEIFRTKQFDVKITEKIIGNKKEIHRIKIDKKNP